MQSKQMITGGNIAFPYSPMPHTVRLIKIISIAIWVAILLAFAANTIQLLEEQKETVINASTGYPIWTENPTRIVNDFLKLAAALYPVFAIVFYNQIRPSQLRNKKTLIPWDSPLMGFISFIVMVIAISAMTAVVLPKPAVSFNSWAEQRYGVVIDKPVQAKANEQIHFIYADSGIKESGMIVKKDTSWVLYDSSKTNELALKGDQ